MYFPYPEELQPYIKSISSKDMIPKKTLPKELRPMFKVTRNEFRKFRKKYRYEPMFIVLPYDSDLLGYVDKEEEYKKNYTWLDDLWFTLRTMFQK